MDGLHVIGPPAVLHVFKDREQWRRHDPAEKAAAAEQAKLEVQALPAVDAAVEGLMPELLDAWMGETAETLRAEEKQAAREAREVHYKQAAEKRLQAAENKAAQADEERKVGGGDSEGRGNRRDGKDAKGRAKDAKARAKEGKGAKAIDAHAAPAAAK